MMKTKLAIVALLSSYLVACAKLPPVSIHSSDHSDSAPVQKKDVSTIADALPQPVKRTRAGNRSPYTVLGNTYTLLPSSQGYRQQGYASWYGTKFHGRKTANGETYDMWGMTAAHKRLPIPSYVRVSNPQNGRSIIVKVNDRGPFHDNRLIDLSYAAALKLGFAEKGVTWVEVVDVTPVTPIKRPPVTVKATNGTYLQLGAFSKYDSAKGLQKKLQHLDYPIAIAHSSDTWYRVHLGPVEVDQLPAIKTQLHSLGITPLLLNKP